MLWNLICKNWGCTLIQTPWTSKLQNKSSSGPFSPAATTNPHLFSIKRMLPQTDVSAARKYGPKPALISLWDDKIQSLDVAQTEF